MPFIFPPFILIYKILRVNNQLYFEPRKLKYNETKQETPIFLKTGEVGTKILTVRRYN